MVVNPVTCNTSLELQIHIDQFVLLWLHHRRCLSLLWYLAFSIHCSRCALTCPFPGCIFFKVIHKVDDKISNSFARFFFLKASLTWLLRHELTKNERRLNRIVCMYMKANERQTKWKKSITEEREFKLMKFRVRELLIIVLTGNKHSFPFQITKGTTLHWYFSNYLGNFRYPGNVSNY